MRLNGEIGSAAVGLGFLAVFVIVANLVERRLNPQPPRERYLRNPNDLLFVAFWNVLSSEKWTEEGLAFHRRRLQFIPVALLTFGVGWLILDWLW
jgi:hypothetical protein